jgi:methionyl-tRNA synthetase
VAVMVNRYQEGVIGTIPEASHDSQPYHQAFAELRLDKAFDYIWSLVRGLNQYIDEEKPWVIAKEKDDQHLQEVLAYTISSLLQISSLLIPFMPTTAAVIKATFEQEIVKPYKGVLFPKIYLHTKDRHEKNEDGAH